MKNIILLGASGSIGESTLKVLRKHPDRLRLLGIAGHSRWEELASIAQEFQVPHVGIFDETSYQAAKSSGNFLQTTQWHVGATGLCELATLPEANMLVMAVVGTAGLIPTLEAIAAGKEIALASKEVLVKAGKFVMAAAKENHVPILPIDSEHNALYQCLQGHKHEHVEKLILTASGGAFRERPLNTFNTITPEEALKHPNWDMGPKVTVDSSTMANKGLELIEARWLYNMAPERLDVVIHPQSIVHSMVQYIDGSILGHFSPPSMTFPIQHCLFHPERAEAVQKTLDFSKMMQLEFRPADMQRYPCLRLALEALQTDGVAPAVFNAANEVAVDAFLQGKIPYLDIAKVIEKTLEGMNRQEPQTLDAILAADLQARERAAQCL